MDVRLVQILELHLDEAIGYLGLDDKGRVWSGTVGVDRLSRDMIEWHPVRALFHELAPGD